MLYEIRMKDLRNEALAEGILKGKINAAKSFLRMGLPAAQVVQGTGLPPAEVQRLQAEPEAEGAQDAR